jgi:trk system potassium uptake protein TrkA
MAQIVVIGLGRFGFHVARELFEARHEVLAVDVDPDIVQRIRNHASRAVVLDARDAERLEALGVRDFDAAVVSLGELIDVSSLVTLHLKEIGVKRLITKAGSEDHGKLLRLIGVDEVIFPEREAAERLAHRLTSTDLLQHLPLGEGISIDEIAPHDWMLGKTLAELGLPRRFNVQVLAARDALTGQLRANPGAGFRVKESDSLLVVGDDASLLKLQKS